MGATRPEPPRQRIETLRTGADGWAAFEFEGVHRLNPNRRTRARPEPLMAVREVTDTDRVRTAGAQEAETDRAE
jgi:hypothetical protein